MGWINENSYEYEEKKRVCLCVREERDLRSEYGAGDGDECGVDLRFPVCGGDDGAGGQEGDFGASGDVAVCGGGLEHWESLSKSR